MYRRIDDRPSPYLRLMAGEYLPPLGIHDTGSGGLFLDQVNAIPFFVPEPTSFDRIIYRVQTEAANGEMLVGVYADNGFAYPGSLVLDAGTVNLSTPAGPSDRAITVSFQRRGLFWVLAWWNGGTANPSLKQAAVWDMGPAAKCASNWLSSGDDISPWLFKAATYPAPAVAPTTAPVSMTFHPGSSGPVPFLRAA